MRNFFLAALFLFCQSVFADYIDIDIPAIDPVENGSEIIPAIDGYELDGTEEKIILPYKKFSFSSRIVKVEILKKRTVEFMMPLKKGESLYRLSDYKKVKPVTAENMVYPSVDKFFFIANPTLKGNVSQFSFNLYPVIPKGETSVTKIDKVRVHLENAAPQTMAPTKGRDSLLILTSELVKSKSHELGNFIDAKRADGFRVDVVTEKDYEGGDLKGIERALKIRSFLKKVASDYYFLLIIGNPLPGGNDVPMIVSKPNKGEVETGYEPVPTDMFFAEVTEDIDKNKNGIYGERADKVEIAAEFIVGRIPFYYDNVEDVDRILERTVRYIKEKPSMAEYRKKMLFPTSIAYYAMQDGQFGMPKMDGAYVVEYLKKSVLDESFTTKTLVESEGGSPSEFIDEESLTYNSMLSNWNDGYGAVFWMAHGMPTYSVRTIWQGDRNGNQFPDSYEMESSTFVDSDMAGQMNDLSPFVFQGSCLNGTVEVATNLAFSILLNSAVGVVGASQVSYGSIFSNYNLSSQDIFSYGAVFIDALADNKFPAQILQDKRESWSDNNVLATVRMEINYLGDPSLNINMKECSEDSDCDDGIYCNGEESCSEGYCEKNFDALPCNSGSDVCRTSVCDEIQKACVDQNRPDGFYCGETGSLCFAGKQCSNGECVDSEEKSCTDLDSPCSKGECNSNTGLCELKIINEGSKCDDGMFCTENETCSKGICSGNPMELPEERPCSKVICDDGSQSFMYLTDHSQNWNSCAASSGSDGYCYYGVCKADEENAESESSSGCAVIVL